MKLYNVLKELNVVPDKELMHNYLHGERCCTSII